MKRKFGKTSKSLKIYDKDCLHELTTLLIAYHCQPISVTICSKAHERQHLHNPPSLSYNWCLIRKKKIVILVTMVIPEQVWLYQLRKAISISSFYFLKEYGQFLLYTKYLWTYEKSISYLKWSLKHIFLQHLNMLLIQYWKQLSACPDIPKYTCMGWLNQIDYLCMSNHIQKIISHINSFWRYNSSIIIMNHFGNA